MNTLIRFSLALLLTSLLAHAQFLTGRSAAFQAAAPSGGSFVPTDIASLKVWLKSESLSGSDGDTVTTWADATANGWDFTASGGTEPYLTNNVVGTTFEAVHFQAASNDNMFAPAGALGLHRNKGGATVVIVYARKSASTNRKLYYSSIAAGSNPRLDIGINNTNSANYYVQSRREDPEATVASDSSALPAGWNILTVISDWTNGAVYSWNGDTAGISDASWTSTGNTSDADSLDIRLGGTGAGSRTIEGQMAEVLVFDTALSSTDRQNVIDYLQAKFGL